MLVFKLYGYETSIDLVILPQLRLPILAGEPIPTWMLSWSADIVYALWAVALVVHRPLAKLMVSILLCTFNIVYHSMPHCNCFAIK